MSEEAKKTEQGDKNKGVLIHVVTGPPCVGKSTYIQEHRAYGDCVIDFDRLGFALGGESTHDFPPLVLEVAGAAYQAAMDAVTVNNNGRAQGSVWIEWPLPPGHRSIFAIQSLVNTYGAIWHKLDEPMEVCLKRADNDKRPQRTYGCIRSYFEHKE